MRNAFPAMLVLSNILVMTACSTVPLYSNAAEDYIELEGLLDTNKAYKVRVVYRTQSESSHCTHYDVFVGTVQDKQSFDYFPITNGPHYKMQVPLKAVDPETDCAWRPKEAWICTAPISDPESMSCYGVIRFGRGILPAYNWDACHQEICGIGSSLKRIDRFNQVYELDLTTFPSEN